MTTAISTNNWDTAFGITFAQANAAIATQGSSPAGFSGSHSTLGSTAQVSADFGPWRMTGGAGSLLRMTLPLSAGNVTEADQSAAFAGSADIQVSLGYLPRPGTSISQLKVDMKKAVSVLGLTLTQGPDTAADSIKGALGDWLSANLQQFNHVFAAVDLNTQADTGEFAWLQPTHLGYAVYTENIASPDDYLFGVLAMTQNRAATNLSPQLDPAVIPTGSDAGFLIAAPRVMDEMFAPHVATLFTGDTPASFDRLDDGMTLYNTTQLGLPDFVLSDGTKISDAGIDSDGFNLSIGTGSVVISFTGLTFTYRPGYTVTVNYRSVNSMGTDANGHLQLVQMGAPTVSMSISESSGEKWKEIWEGIGIAIAGAVVGAVVGAGAEAGMAARAAAQAAEATAQAGSQAGGEVGVELQNVVDALTPAERVQNEINALKSAVAALRNPEAPMTFVGFFRANALKLLGAAIGAAVGGAVGSIPAILDGYADENRDDMPTLDAFAAKAIGNTTWAGGPSFTLTAADLRGALQLSLKKKTAT